MYLIILYHKESKKGNTVPVFNLAPHHEDGGMEFYIHTLLTSVLDGGEWSASCSGHCTTNKRDSSTHWRGVWVGPRASLNMVAKRKIPAPAGD
jgi:hypothetical protein